MDQVWKMEVGSSTDRNSGLIEKVKQKETVKASISKLEITDYQAGTMQWKNVGIKNSCLLKHFQTPANQQIFVKLQK